MKQLTQAEISMPYKPAPITLGNMRAVGARTLAEWCLGRGWAGFEIRSDRILKS
jgi:hypothetical protein